MNKFKSNFLELVPDLSREAKPTIIHKKGNTSIEDVKTLMIIKELEGLVAKQVAMIRNQKEKQKLMMPKSEVPRYEANILVGDKVNKVAENQEEAKENQIEVSDRKENEENNTKTAQGTSAKKGKEKRVGETLKNEELRPKTKGGELQKNRIKVYKSSSGKTQRSSSSSSSGHGKRSRTRRVRTRSKKS